MRKVVSCSYTFSNPNVDLQMQTVNIPKAAHDLDKCTYAKEISV